MSPFVSIRTKLIRSSMALIGAIFAIVLILVFVMNILSLRANLKMTERNILGAIVAKGKTLVTNNSMAMRGMAADNAFTAVQDLVSATVKNDSAVDYGIYMDGDRLAWAISTRGEVEAKRGSEPLADSMSHWAAGLRKPGHKQHVVNGHETIEFAAPVSVDGEIAGTIRYGLSTEPMKISLSEARHEGTAALVRTIALLLCLVVGSTGAGFYLIRRLADRITQPIAQLAKSSKVIAAGDYGSVVQVDSNDEIGNLAHDFESMRETIKKYTDHLQELVDEKMQQVNDILNNIDQGLFTINLDGTVNPEHSARALTILRVPQLAGRPLREILRFDEKADREFVLWLDLVQKRHKNQRWTKLTRLAPVRELELTIPLLEQPEMEYVSIDYQKIYDKNGQLSKIMILAKDETEARVRELQMQEERIRHESDVKTILGIANTPPDEISEFMEDTQSRLRQLRKLSERHLAGVMKQRGEYPAGEAYELPGADIDALYRDLHTIKGNSGSYGFEMLSKHAHDAEEILEILRQSVVTRRSDTLQQLLNHVGYMEKDVSEIKDRISSIMGKEDEVTMRIPESRVRSILEKSAELAPSVTDERLGSFFAECRTLTWKPLKALTRKYQKVVAKAARTTNKNVELIVSQPQLYLPADTLLPIDDVLVHLIRNAVDHGIEPPSTREELGKGIGRIVLEYQEKDQNRVVVLSDDGQGIDAEKLIRIGIDKGILSPAQAANLSPDSAFELMFHSGLSTAEEVTEVSGRGMGMGIVRQKIGELGGSLTIRSNAGKGTVFTVRYPSHCESQRAA